MERRANIRSWLLCAALAAAALAVTPAAQAARFGFADDAGKYADDGGGPYFNDLKAAGGTDNRITVHWDPARPDAIPEKSFLDRALPVAKAKGVRVVLHVFPLTPTALSSPAAAEDFSALLARLAKEYPQVREFVVGNEPNQPRFLRPQFSPTGNALAAAAYVSLLARSYDALKAVDPAIRVIGLGLSGRGNDLPLAPSNASTSPVRFLRDLGAAYRASGRTLPLMDELGLHLYPRSDRDPVRAGDRWPRAGIVNLARLKQAVWDAFAGTGQPTVEQGLKLRIDEIGWQAVVPAGAAMPTAAARPSPRRPRRRRPTTTRRWSRWPPATAASRPSTSCTCGTIRISSATSRASGAPTARCDRRTRRCEPPPREPSAAAPVGRSRGATPRGWSEAERSSGPDPRRVPPADELGLQRHRRRGDLLRRRHLPRRREQAGAKPGLATGAGRRDDDGRKRPRRLEPAPALRLALPEARPVRLRGRLRASMNPRRSTVLVSRTFVVR